MCSLRSRQGSTARLGGRQRAGCGGVSLRSDDMPKPGEAEAELCRYTRHDLRNAQAHLFLCEEVDRPFEERAKAKAKVAAKLRAWLAAQSALDAFVMRGWRAFRWTAFPCPSPLEILDHGAERQCIAFHGTDQSGQDRPVPSRRRSSPSRITTSKAKFPVEISVLQVRQSVLSREKPGQLRAPPFRRGCIPSPPRRYLPWWGAP
jgi:hypothetical protein